MPIKIFHKILISAYSLSFMGLFWSWPSFVSATPFATPDQLPPTGRVPAGTRGYCIPTADDPPLNPQENELQQLTALVPKTNLGLTVSGYPTFYWYVPTLPPRTVEFVLIDENDQEIYKTTFLHDGQSGIISLSLPANAGLPPLEVGKYYHWYFSVICKPKHRDTDIFAEGWVQRIEPSQMLTEQLSQTTLDSERADLYAEAGIWHEALMTLAELRRDDPTNSDLAEDWRELLQALPPPQPPLLPLNYIDLLVAAPLLPEVNLVSEPGPTSMNR